MTRLDFPDDPDEFATLLEDAGMPPGRARVYAHYVHNIRDDNTNQKTADDLDKNKSTVSEHYKEALNEKSEARKLTHYMYEPEYLSVLPDGAGRHLDEHVEHTVAFRLHRPRELDDGTYSLASSNVLEAFYIDDDSYLLAHHRPTHQNRARTTYFTIESQFLVRFIHDWVVPIRLRQFREGGRDNELADQYFLTDAFEPEWLEEQLAEVGIERVEVLTDNRFTNPLDEHGVTVRDAALTGQTHDGYTVAYSPTEREVGHLLVNYEIDDEEAERMTRISPDRLRALVE